nr:E3 ubiquitin-protein ligase UPL2-like [Tanacetum cinerariifolium]
MKEKYGIDGSWLLTSASSYEKRRNSFDQLYWGVSATLLWQKQQQQSRPNSDPSSQNVASSSSAPQVPQACVAGLAVAGATGYTSSRVKKDPTKDVVHLAILHSMFLLNCHQQSYLNYITFLNEKDKPQAATDGIIKHSEAISKSAKVHRKPPQSFTMQQQQSRPNSDPSSQNVASSSSAPQVPQACVAGLAVAGATGYTSSRVKKDPTKDVVHLAILHSMFLLNCHQQSYLNYITFLNEKDKPQAATDGIIKHSEAISKSAKVHRKPPQSFTMVIELLLESIITFVPPSEDKAVVGESSLVIDMEIDVASSKGKGKAIASGSEEKEDTGQESSESLAKVVYILKLLKEILLMYGPFVHVLVRKDAEFSSSHGGGIFHHILGSFLPHSRNSKRENKTDADWRHKLAAFIDVLDDVLAARSRARSPTGSSISGEACATFIGVGLVRSLTRTLHLLDFDHADSLKVAPALVKVLELVTKEHVHASTENASLPNASFAPAEVVESFSTVQAYGGSEFVTNDVEHDQDIDGGYTPPSEDDFKTRKVGDACSSEIEFGIFCRLSHSERSNRLRFKIQPDIRESLDEDEEDMPGDEDDEINEDEDGDDEGRNDLEEDEEHHLPHPDTNQDDHEIEDEFDEDMIEEEDEEDDDGGVILRLGEGMNGINLLDHVEVFGRDHSVPNDTLHVMPVEVFGSRRQGRTTSIYNLLGDQIMLAMDILKEFWSHTHHDWIPFFISSDVDILYVEQVTYSNGLSSVDFLFSLLPDENDKTDQ